MIVKLPKTFFIPLVIFSIAFFFSPLLDISSELKYSLESFIPPPIVKLMLLPLIVPSFIISWIISVPVYLIGDPIFCIQSSGGRDVITCNMIALKILYFIFAVLVSTAFFLTFKGINHILHR